MSFTGKYKYQTSEHYDEYLRLLKLSWLQRKKSTVLAPLIEILEKPVGTLNITGDGPAIKKVVLGEEFTQTLPNGDKVKGVTVREGDNCLITRLRSPWNFEIREEFTSQGMMQVIRHLDSELEAVRNFKRVEDKKSKS